MRRRGPSGRRGGSNAWFGPRATYHLNSFDLSFDTLSFHFLLSDHINRNEHLSWIELSEKKSNRLGPALRNYHKKRGLTGFKIYSGWGQISHLTCVQCGDFVDKLEERSVRQLVDGMAPRLRHSVTGVNVLHVVRRTLLLTSVAHFQVLLKLLEKACAE